MTNTNLIVYIGGAVMLLGLILVLFSLKFLRSNPVSQRINTFVSDYSMSGTDSRKTSGSAGDSFFNRTIAAGIRRLVAFLGQVTPQRSVEETARKLSVAGIDLRAREFLGLELLVALIGAAIALLVFLTNDRRDLLGWLMYGAIILFFALLPSVWLNSRVRKSTQEIRDGLPDALDMLSVCAYAGLGFDQSLQRVSDYWQTLLGLSFRRVVQELELGVSRADALRNMSERLQIAELSSFVAVILQAESLGMPISDVLHTQAEQMRILRQFRAKEMANRLPARILIPLALLILPALLAVILAPLVPSLIDLFSGF